MTTKKKSEAVALLTPEDYDRATRSVERLDEWINLNGSAHPDYRWKFVELSKLKDLIKNYEKSILNN